MITTLIILFFGLAAFALVWWGISRLTLPEPVKTVVLVLVGLVALWFLYNLFVGHSISLR